MACSKPVPVLSFAAIVQGRDSSVRVTDDGLGDVVDVVMVVTGKNCNHSNEALRNLSPSLFDNEKLVIRNGRRYATLRDIITLKRRYHARYGASRQDGQGNSQSIC